MSPVYKIFLFFLILISCNLISVSCNLIHAQLPDFSIATTYNIKEPDMTNGDIVSMSSKDGSLHLSKTSYDESMHGVYVQFPKIDYRTPGNSYPVVRNGEVDVNVTDINGDINIGEYISSSVIPGKGMKATEFTGYMLGVAIAPFAAKDGSNITFNKKSYKMGKIKVAIGIGPASPSVIKASGGIFGTLRFLSSNLFYNISNSKQVEKIIKIILAVIIAVSSIAFSILFFGKNVTQGIESIGRNPLAKTTIQSMIVLNVVLIATIAIGGIIVALVIISL